jgi:hypothetical protein
MVMKSETNKALTYGLEFTVSHPITRAAAFGKISVPKFFTFTVQFSAIVPKIDGISDSIFLVCGRYRGTDFNLNHFFLLPMQ